MSNTGWRTFVLGILATSLILPPSSGGHAQDLRQRQASAVNRQTHSQSLQKRPMHGPVKADSTNRTESRERSRDVALSRDGVLTMVLIDAQGRPRAAEPVQLKQGNRLLASLKTDANGRIQVRVTRGGVYQVASRYGFNSIRVWPRAMAPPAIRSSALLVHDRAQVRGQTLDTLSPLDAVTTLELAGLGAAAWFGIDAYRQEKKNEERIAALATNN